MSRVGVVVAILFISLISSGYADEEYRSLPFNKNETLTYQVKYKGLNVGESVLTFHGKGSLGDDEFYHITFFTRVNAFTDVEELFADKTTFLPVEVQRTLKRFGTFTTKITEKYDQENFKVDIEKKSRFRRKEISIEKDSPIHNAILLAYFCRTRQRFDDIEVFDVTLPTIDFKVSFVREELIETPMGEFRAYAFASDPPTFKFWLSTDKRRTPLMIENPSMIGYSLVIKEISP